MKLLILVLLFISIFSYSDLESLTRVVYCEGNGESDKSKLGIAYTVVNRSLLSGKSIAFEATKKNQFCVYSGDMLDNDKLEKCQDAAKSAINRSKMDPTNGATYTFSGSIVPLWAKGRTPCAIIGSRKFYKHLGEYNSSI